MTLLKAGVYQGYQIKYFMQAKFFQENTHGFHHSADALPYFPTYWREEIIQYKIEVNWYFHSKMLRGNFKGFLNYGLMFAV